VTAQVSVPEDSQAATRSCVAPAANDPVEQAADWPPAVARWRAPLH